jgi:hypothetical protein
MKVFFQCQIDILTGDLVDVICYHRMSEPSAIAVLVQIAQNDHLEGSHGFVVTCGLNKSYI